MPHLITDVHFKRVDAAAHPDLNTLRGGWRRKRNKDCIKGDLVNILYDS